MSMNSQPIDSGTGVEAPASTPVDSLQPMADKFLTIRRCFKHFGGVTALDGATLSLAAGEVHGLMGENGAGKSTLIKILAGVVQADEVEIELQGRPVEIVHPGEARRLGLRFIHQELNVVPHLSVAENLFLGQPYPRRFGTLIDWRGLNRRAAAVLGRLEVDHIRPEAKMARLSVGDRMLVRIAGALLAHGAEQESAEGKIYVMDEPTAALTGAESERLYRVIHELRSQGCVILYVSHRIDEVLTLCDRITVLRDGSTVATLGSKNTDRHELIRLMTGRRMSEAFPAKKGEPSHQGVLFSVSGVAGSGIESLSLQVREGEVLGIAGLAGSGEADVLRLLVGADPVERWEGQLSGAPLPSPTVEGSWRRGIAYVARERRSQGLILSRSVGDNVTLPHLQKLKRAGVFQNRALEDRLTRKVGERVRLRATGPGQITYQLSGGNQQKVLFSRALLDSPRLLLLDEPTRGVDVAAKYDIYLLIREVAAAGGGVIIASTDHEELLGMCDRILIIREGRSAEIVENRNLSHGDLLTLCYGAEVEA